MLSSGYFADFILAIVDYARMDIVTSVEEINGALGLLRSYFKHVEDLDKLGGKRREAIYGIAQKLESIEAILNEDTAKTLFGGIFPNGYTERFIHISPTEAKMAALYNISRIAEMIANGYSDSLGGKGLIERLELDKEDTATAQHDTPDE